MRILKKLLLVKDFPYFPKIYKTIAIKLDKQ